MPAGQKLARFFETNDLEPSVSDSEMIAISNPVAERHGKKPRKEDTADATAAIGNPVAKEAFNLLGGRPKQERQMLRFRKDIVQTLWAMKKELNSSLPPNEMAEKIVLDFCKRHKIKIKA